MEDSNKINARSAKLKLKMLLAGIRIDDSAFAGLGERYKEYQYGYNDSNWLDKKKQQMIPSELLLPGGIVVAPHLRPGSPYLIKNESGKLSLYDEVTGEYLSAVEYLPRPKIWDICLDDGTSIKKYLNIYGRDCLNLFIVANCEFWKAGLPCNFCSLRPTQKFHEEVVMFKPLDKIEEALQKAFSSSDEINWMIITGGSLLDRNAELKRYCDVLNIISKYIPSEWGGKIRGNGALLPSGDEKDLYRLFETGIEHPSFNLEVWSRDLFARFCPRKEKYAGFDRLLKTYKTAVKIWGTGEVWCNFVGGISSIANLKEGFRELADMGVVPGANIFHIDPAAPAARQGFKEPTEDYVYELYGTLNEIYRNYHYKPFFSAGVLRNSLSNEYYNGWM